MSRIRVEHSFIYFLAYLILSNPVLAKTNAGKLFFNFLNFFAVFFLQFSPPGRIWAEFGSKIILSLSRPISSYLIPLSLKITPESCFFNFLNFFSEFSPSGRVWEEFGFNIRLSLSWPISSYLIPFCRKLTLASCFLIFWIFLQFFFGIFSLASGMSGIRV